MGGAVFVGIRFPSGKEVLTEQWTNPMSGWFCNKRFLEGDEAFLEELMAFEEGDEWPKNEGRDAVFPSEYGVVLIDFVNMKAFSRQDYARLGTLHFSTMYYGCVEDVRQVVELYRAGLLEKIECDLPVEVEFTTAESREPSALLQSLVGPIPTPGFTIACVCPPRDMHDMTRRDMTEKEMEELLGMLAEGGVPSFRCTAHVRSPFEIDDTCERPHDEKGRLEVEKFLSDNGWETKALTREEWEHGGRICWAGLGETRSKEYPADKTSRQ